MVRVVVEKVARIEGGFVLVPIAELMAAWRACRSSPLGIGDFRTWLACRELVARRCLACEGRAVSYGFPELARLLGVTAKRARASVRRLEAAGLIARSDSAIEILDLVSDSSKFSSSTQSLTDSIGQGRGSVAIPRRMLRFLASGSRPAMIATSLGILLRCLGRRKGGWNGRGRVKASWIARVFDVDLRRVKQARKDLIDLGWVAPEPTDQWAENRWGRAYTIDLAWTRKGSEVGRRLPPPPSAGGRRLPPPNSDPEPLREDKNQEPAPGGPAGVEIQGQGTPTPTPTPPSLPTPTPSPLLAPKLADIQAADLKDTGRLLDLHRQAVAKGVVTTSEADRLRFVATAEHALAIGKGNPPGLFAYLIRGRCWRYVTGADEDRANARIKAHLRGRGPSVEAVQVDGSRPIQARDLRRSEGVPVYPPVSMGRPALSEDAVVVREVRAACIRAGIYRDPWAAFQSRNPVWTRGRWDAALHELGCA